MTGNWKRGGPRSAAAAPRSGALHAARHSERTDPAPAVESREGRRASACGGAHRLICTTDVRLFLVYLARLNELAEQAEFYNLLSNNCTINIVRYANAAGRIGRLDLRHILNGLIDRYLYDTGRIDTTLPFAELRQRSHINDAARAAGDAPDFSDRIRAGLPAMDR